MSTQPNNCRQSYETSVQMPVPIRHPYWLSQRELFPWNHEKQIHTEYAKLLKEKKDSYLIGIIEAKNPKSKKIITRQQKTKNFLTNIQKIDKERFNIVVVKSVVDGERTKYFIVPKEAQPPIN